MRTAMIDTGSLMFEMLKGGVDKYARDAIGASMAGSITRQLGVAAPPPNPSDAEVVDRLTATGFAPVAPMFDAAALAEIDAYFATQMTTYSNEEAAAPGAVHCLPANRPEGLRFGLWSQEVLSRCPAFCRAAHDPGLLRLAWNYLGAPPTITIMTGWWSYPSALAGAGMQKYHHDRDDFRMLKVFAYLTDVTETSGPHQFVEQTHSFAAMMAMMGKRSWESKAAQDKFVRWMDVHRKDDADIARFIPPENIRTITGAKGSTFFEDTRGLHRGLPPVDKPRQVFEICYSLIPKHNTEYQPIPRPPLAQPIDPAIAYATRLFYSDAAA